MQNKSLEHDFLKVVQLNERIIYKVTSFYATDKENINDLYQEIILNLWKAFATFRNESKISTWIYRISLNTCITYYRRTKKHLQHEFSIAFEIADIQTDNNDEIAELYRLIGKLEKLEKALILLYLDEKPYKEISEITGLTVTNVATKISRIKEKLKKMSDQ